MFYCGFTCVLFMMSFRCVYDSLVFAFMLRLRCFMLVLYVFGLCKALSLRSGSYRRSPLGLPKVLEMLGTPQKPKWAAATITKQTQKLAKKNQPVTTKYFPFPTHSH